MFDLAKEFGQDMPQWAWFAAMVYRLCHPEHQLDRWHVDIWVVGGSFGETVLRLAAESVKYAFIPMSTLVQTPSTSTRMAFESTSADDHDLWRRLIDEEMLSATEEEYKDDNGKEIKLRCYKSYPNRGFRIIRNAHEITTKINNSSFSVSRRVVPFEFTSRDMSTEQLAHVRANIIGFVASGKVIYEDMSQYQCIHALTPQSMYGVYTKLFIPSSSRTAPQPRRQPQHQPGHASRNWRLWSRNKRLRLTSCEVTSCCEDPPPNSR